MPTAPFGFGPPMPRSPALMPNGAPLPPLGSNGLGPRPAEVRATPEQRAFLVPLVIPRGHSEPQLGLPGIIYEPLQAMARMLEGSTAPADALAVAGGAATGAVPFGFAFGPGNAAGAFWSSLFRRGGTRQAVQERIRQLRTEFDRLLELGASGVRPRPPTGGWKRPEDELAVLEESVARARAELPALRARFEGRFHSLPQAPLALAPPPPGGSIPPAEGLRMLQAQSVGVVPGQYVHAGPRPLSVRGGGPLSPQERQLISSYDRLRELAEVATSGGRGKVVAEADPRYGPQLARERGQRERYEGRQRARAAYETRPTRATEERIERDVELDEWMQRLLGHYRGETSNAPSDVMSSRVSGFERFAVNKAMDPLAAGAISDQPIAMQELIKALIRRGYWFRDAEKHLNMAVLHERIGGRFAPLTPQERMFRELIAKDPEIRELANRVNRQR